jgi:prepilin-type N-terminal cleavage/methylation domain-containing protein
MRHFYGLTHTCGSLPLAATGRAEDGFTLLEILVSLIVLGIISVAVAHSIKFGISADDMEIRLIHRSQDMERLDRVIRGLIEHASPPVSNEDRPFSGEEHRLSFVTELPDEPEDQPVRRARVAIGVNDQLHLVVRWQPSAHAVPLSEPTEPSEILISTGFARVDISYRHVASEGGNWAATWDQSSLPALVRLHFVSNDPAKRWPDIIVRTMLDVQGNFRS